MDLNYIRVKLKNKWVKTKIVLKALVYSLPVVVLSSVAIMLFFDFFMKTGIGYMQFVECIAVYFLLNEIKPVLDDTVFFK